jgi:hypothetical protein
MGLFFPKHLAKSLILLASLPSLGSASYFNGLAPLAQFVSSKCPASEQEQPLLGDAILGHPDHNLSVLTEGLGQYRLAAPTVWNGYQFLRTHQPVPKILRKRRLRKPSKGAA